MEKETREILNYINSLLNDSNTQLVIPDNLKEIEELIPIDQTLRNLRHSIRTLGDGELSEKLVGKGYLIGTVKSLQATLKNLIWQTQEISSGNYSNRISFLGQFSDAFNGMVKKLDSTIREVQEAKELFELFFETIPDATLIMSYDEFEIFNCNHAFERLTGISKEKLLGEKVNSILFKEDKSQEKKFEEAIKGIEKSQGISLKLNLSGNDTFIGLFSSAIIYIEDKKYIVSVIKDITERKLMEDEIRRITEIDHLTQLYNRLKLDKVLKSEIDRSRRSKSLFSIILLDIDDFKLVNDNFGHIVGDEVLKDISLIIKNNIRKTDFAARWGGEEFMIILTESNITSARTLADKIRRKINTHNFLNAGRLTASFGIAEFNNDLSEIELVSRVDKAMYKAKSSGKDCIHESK